MTSIHQPKSSPTPPHSTNSRVSHGNGNGSTSRLHLSVGTMIGKILKSGDEADSKKPYARSSLSGEDSGREGEGAKSDGVTSLKSDRRRSPLPGSTSQRLIITPRDAAITSDSDHSNGQATAKVTGRFLKRGASDNFWRLDKNTIPEGVEGSLSAVEAWQTDSLGPATWFSARGTKRVRVSPPSQEMGREQFQNVLRKLEEEEERAREIYKTRELLLIEANDHNRKIARLLKAVSARVREYDSVQKELSRVLSIDCSPVPAEIMDAVSADPATTLRHGQGWSAVEDSYERFNRQQNLLTSYLAIIQNNPEDYAIPSLQPSIETATDLWRGLQERRQYIQGQVQKVKPALKRASEHVESVQRDYNETQILVESDYPEVSHI
ncbi:hypothetical protein M422DRAFT_55172 [Sphaerobolus stellatus SS14]|uniref:Uncharacterized protein n=1 Tax=Sphaerobolus stellatus (strain SS14) TaxID=990650 RepID=A0A0C9TZC7_SPHS4|nr:hypothetical protein M422DRAFT_55172 [Sphaerobolus stellatus SS14]